MVSLISEARIGSCKFVVRAISVWEKTTVRVLRTFPLSLSSLLSFDYHLIRSNSTRCTHRTCSSHYLPEQLFFVSLSLFQQPRFLLSSNSSWNVCVGSQRENFWDAISGLNIRSLQFLIRLFFLLFLSISRLPSIRYLSLPLSLHSRITILV